MLKQLLKKYNIPHKIIAEALGLNRINIDRYDDLMERSVNEVMLISKATGISFSELLGISDPETKKVDKLIIKYPESPDKKNEVLIESMKQTINALENALKTKEEIIEILKNKDK